MNLITKFLLVAAAVVIPNFLVNAGPACDAGVLAQLGYSTNVKSPTNLRITSILTPQKNAGNYLDEYPVLFTDVAKTSNPLSGTFNTNNGYIFPGGQGSRPFSATANPGGLKSTVLVVEYNPSTFQFTGINSCTAFSTDPVLLWDGGVAGTNYIVTVINENGKGNVNFNLCLRDPNGPVGCSVPQTAAAQQQDVCGDGEVQVFEQCDTALTSECCASPSCTFAPTSVVCNEISCDTCDFAGQITCSGSNGNCPTEVSIPLELVNANLGRLGVASVIYDRSQGVTRINVQMDTSCFKVTDSNVWWGPESAIPKRSTGTPDLAAMTNKLSGVFAQYGNWRANESQVTSCPASVNALALVLRVQVVQTCNVATKGVLYNTYARGTASSPARYSKSFSGGATYSVFNVCFN